MVVRGVAVLRNRYLVGTPPNDPCGPMTANYLTGQPQRTVTMTPEQEAWARRWLDAHPGACFTDLARYAFALIEWWEADWGDEVQPTPTWWRGRERRRAIGT